MAANILFLTLYDNAASDVCAGAKDVGGSQAQ
jgi:hypothetical protein